MKLNATILMAYALSGCATMSPEECLQANWEEVGYNDAIEGYPVSRSSEHREACASTGVTVDFALYRDGHALGLPYYCTRETGFETADNERVWRALLEENRRHSTSLDGIAQCGTSSMRLQCPQAVCSEACIGHRRHQYASLRLSIGRRQACAALVLANRATTHTDHHVLLVHSTNYRVDSLAACVSVRPHVKGMASTTCRREARDRVTEHRRWIENHVHARA